MQTQGEAKAHKEKWKYASAKSVVLWIEVALALYFAGMIALAAARGQWLSLPFLSLFFFGFVYVSSGSLMKRFQMGNSGS